MPRETSTVGGMRIAACSFPWCQKAKEKKSLFKMFIFDFLKRGP